MAVEHIARAFQIDDLVVLVTAWRYVCDDCGQKETFPDSPMPEGASEFAPQRRGWRIFWDADDAEKCRCPGCGALRDAAVVRKIPHQQSDGGSH